MAASARRKRPSKAAQHVSSTKAQCQALSLLIMAFFYIFLQLQAQYLLDGYVVGAGGLAPQGNGQESSYMNLFRIPHMSKLMSSMKINLPAKPYRFMGDLALESEQKMREQEAAKLNQLANPRRFIIFQPIQAGQGLGNIVSGLLAAHLLGEEFNRIVCVSNEYSDFLQMFEPIHELVVKHCRYAFEQYRNTSLAQRHEQSIRLVTFEQAPNECFLQQNLRDGPDVVYMVLNTYPRWPRIPTTDVNTTYFSKYYRPTRKLLQALPWKTASTADSDGALSNLRAKMQKQQLLDNPPTTVVHLRQSDGAQDQRKGLDEATFMALGKLLPSDTFLVTNRVDWYDYFSKEFGWKHPEWITVIHSALHKQWGFRDENGQHHNDSNQLVPFIPKTVSESDSEKELQVLQMWVDWYTISQAKTVYHTHSDFSISAIHWNDIRNTKTILGFDNAKQELIIVDESWRVDGETAALASRTEFASGTTRLRLCGHNIDRRVAAQKHRGI
ncbi:hypothetical protein MPSEU_000817700 [Mayamaea pseudoterrestris]|nr:hypothetical protein MPSEU_000817700 [Mayamaea pseudoterrestris]